MGRYIRSREVIALHTNEKRTDCKVIKLDFVLHIYTYLFCTGTSILSVLSTYPLLDNIRLLSYIILSSASTLVVSCFSLMFG